MEIQASAMPDPQPVKLVLDATKPGRPFDGIGGNFRRQFSQTDAAVLKYNLENLRVAWSRNDIPWAEWDPDEQTNPLTEARSGQLHSKVRGALETARTLARRRIPLIVSAWNPPKWARAISQPAGSRGTALNPDKMDRVCASLASYLVFLKEFSGMEAVYFSFNEPETGVEVRQTAAEHVQFIKLMGAEFIQRGLTTRLLLGDTAHGTPATLEFIRPALADPTTHRYLGAITFHTWRGCTLESLPGWADAARQVGVPLLVTESGPDAHLHEYPSSEGGLWVIKGGRLRQFREGEWRDVPSGVASLATANGVVELRDGWLAVRTTDQGLWLTHPQAVPHNFSRTNGLPSNWLGYFYPDREGNLWVGSSSGGLSVLRPVAFEPMNPPEHWDGMPVLSVCRAHDDTLWASTEGAGLFHLQDGRWTRYGPGQGLGSRFVWSVLEDAQATPGCRRRHLVWHDGWRPGLLERRAP